MKIGDYDKRMDGSRLGGAVLIGACVILAVRTARRPVTVSKNDQPHNDLWREVGYAIQLAIEGDENSHVGPRDSPMDNALVLKTRSLEKPVWTVPFDAHGSLTGKANHRNIAELKAWYERLNVLYNHSPQEQR